MAHIATPFRKIGLAAFASRFSARRPGLWPLRRDRSPPKSSRARVLRAVEDGKRPGTDLSTQDVERVGEYVAAPMAGSTSAHRSMNDLMAKMIGERA